MALTGVFLDTEVLIQFEYGWAQTVIKKANSSGQP